MPVQSIKLDRSFVSNLPNKADSVILSRTVLAMAQALGLGVVAEGVETAEQRDFLIESGVLELQGFGLARPMTADDSRQFVWDTGHAGQPERTHQRIHGQNGCAEKRTERH